MPRFKGDSYQDEDYEPDTDGPDTSEADEMLSEATNNPGIGHLSFLKSGGKEFEKYRSEAAKQMKRKPEETEEVEE